MTDLTDEAVKALLAQYDLPTDCDCDDDDCVKCSHYPTFQERAAKQLKAAAPDLARALLDARAEIARLRADAQAAVALVVEQAGLAVANVETGFYDGISGEWHPMAGPSIISAACAAIRSLAPAVGLAAVEALRKERDLARTETTDLLAVSREECNRLAERAQLAEAELAAAHQREARRTFPILKGDGAKIDYQLVADHAEQARSNHGQSVDRLAARGGLSWCELYAVLHNRKWEKVDTNEAMIACRSLEARYLAAAQQREAEWHDGSRPLPFDRDTVGRMVREAWIRWAETQPSPKPSWLVPYDELNEADKEADRQIGEAVARWTLAFDAARAALSNNGRKGE